MTFVAFLGAMYCVYSAADLARFVTENPRMELPLGGPVRLLFYLFAVPTSFGVLALPIYGFFVVAWWQVLIALLVAVFLTGLITRRIPNRHYLWSMGFAAGAIGILVWGAFVG